MDFETYHASVIEHAIAFSDADDLDRVTRRSAVRKPGKRKPRKRKPSQALLDRPEAKQITAAAALVIAERGEDWVCAHPREFRTEIIQHLGTIAQIAITVLSFVTGAGGVWVILARILIPAILSFLSSRSRPMFGAEPASPSDWQGVTETAQQILRGEE